MSNGYWRKLMCEECCFTCKHNRNNNREDYPCNCEFENRKEMISQDMWCNNYEITEDEERLL